MVCAGITCQCPATTLVKACAQPYTVPHHDPSQLQNVMLCERLGWQSGWHHRKKRAVITRGTVDCYSNTCGALPSTCTACLVRYMIHSSLSQTEGGLRPWIPTASTDTRSVWLMLSWAQAFSPTNIMYPEIVCGSEPFLS